MSHRLTDTEYQQIVDANPNVRLARIPTAAGEIVIRNPTPSEEGQFQAMYFGLGATSSLVAWRNLLVMCTVHPSKETLGRWLGEWTGLAMNPRVIQALKKIRGEADEEEAK